jgi:hypothetical protein
MQGTRAAARGRRRLCSLLASRPVMASHHRTATDRLARVTRGDANPPNTTCDVSEDQYGGLHMILLITYDLHKPDRDYEGVIEKLKSFGSWAYDEESVWLVDTTLSPAQCCDSLNSVTTDATYFVAQLRNNWAANIMDKDVVAWLKDPTRRWL